MADRPTPAVRAPTWRLFVALELPLPVTEALAGWLDRAVGPQPGLRAVRREDLHVTLCFLGATATEAVPDILEQCRCLEAMAPAGLTLTDVLWLPRRQPRVLAVKLADAGARLAGVQARLSERLAAGGWYRPERRPFLAHVTVARAGRSAQLVARSVPAPAVPPFAGDRVTLYRSVLGPAGARYQALGTVTLSGAGSTI